MSDLKNAAKTKRLFVRLFRSGNLDRLAFQMAQWWGKIDYTEKEPVVFTKSVERHMKKEFASSIEKNIILGMKIYDLMFSDNFFTPMVDGAERFSIYSNICRRFGLV